MRETLWVPVVAVLGPLIGSAVGVLLPSREGLLHRLLEIGRASCRERV